MAEFTMKEYLAEAMDNVKKLGACKGGHDFIRLPEEEVRLSKRFHCKKCGGRIDWGAMYWYKLGLEHGKANG